MSEITYDDKIDLNVESTIANINKVTASDMNEIKSVVNANAETLDEINVPSNWVKVGDTIPTDGRKVLFKASKNIFNNEDIGGGYKASASISTIETGVRVTSTATGTANYFVTLPIIDVTNYVGKTFTMKCNFTATGTAKGRYIIGLCDKYGGNRVAEITSNTSGESISFTIPTLSNATYLAVWFYVATGTSVTSGNYVDYTNVQIELGSSATTYEPYIKQDLIVNGGKFIADQLLSVGATNSNDGRRVWFGKSRNVFDFQNINYIYTSASSETKLTNGIRVSVATAGGYRYLVYNLGTTSALNGKTIRAKMNIAKSGSNYALYGIAYCDSEGGNRANMVSTTTSGETISFSIGTTNTNICLYLAVNNNSTSQAVGTYADFTDIMITINDTNMTYEPYVQEGIYVDDERYGDNYSYNEQVIGKWVDGKKIYRKVVTFNINTSAMTTQYTHNIANIETIMPSCKALVKRGAVDVYVVPFVYPNSSSDMVNYGIGMNITSTKVILYIGSSMRSAIANYPAIVVLEYTKSTD